jgi:hypothetical protein
VIAAEIPDFWLGVVSGALAAIAAIVVLALYAQTRRK